MPFVNFMSREINCKVVYYGPALAGRLTSLRHVHEIAVPPGLRGRVQSYAEPDRSFLFDFSPKELTVRGFKVRLHLHRAPEPAADDPPRATLLAKCDGLVFVADSRVTRREANLASLEELAALLRENGLSTEHVPLVFQYNKRDLPELCSIEEMEEELNPRRCPGVAAVATRGEGVFEALKECTRLLLRECDAFVAEKRWVVAKKGGDDQSSSE